jgi:DNA ligase (NAD+)
MSKDIEQNIRARMEKLVKQVETLRFRYHVMDDPQVTDEIYDSLTRELRELEVKYPQVKLKNSPTDRVGGQALDKFTKVKHSTRMLSLNDAFNFDEVRDWEGRLGKILGKKVEQYFCELKFDGLAVSLIYKQGQLRRAATRGDGFVGEDVTQNIRTVQSIPLQLPDQLDVEIRGEVIMTKQVWKDLNNENRKQGKAEYANTRNAAAGSVRQLDPKIAASRKLQFMAYDIVTDLGLANHAVVHKKLRELSFRTQQDYEKVCDNLDAVNKFYEQVEKNRDQLPFGIDGIVVQVNDKNLLKSAGIVGKAPRGIVAYKFMPEKVTTVVKDILVQVGRTGKLTPIAVLRPVFVSGTTVSRATLHNEDEIKRLDVRVGDTVVIQRAGDVIPDIVQVLPAMRTGEERRFVMPSKCPVCGTKTERRSQDLIDLYCKNPHCPAKNLRAMEHFVNAFEIYTIGPKILQRFKDEGLISGVLDLFKLKKEDIQSLDQFGEKSAENIVNSIETHKKITLPKFIYALGILHVGEETAFDLAQRFGTIEKLMDAKIEDIVAIPNIGGVVSKSLYEWFMDKSNRQLILDLIKAGVQVESIKIRTSGLSGKNIVVTGTLETLSREQAKEAVREAGANWSSSVSKNTDYVVVGANPGSKAEKAKSLGVKILDEKGFLKLLQK